MNLFIAVLNDKDGFSDFFAIFANNREDAAEQMKKRFENYYGFIPSRAGSGATPIHYDLFGPFKKPSEAGVVFDTIPDFYHADKETL